jgi:hypothetical protein
MYEIMTLLCAAGPRYLGATSRARAAADDRRRSIGFDRSRSQTTIVGDDNKCSILEAHVGRLWLCPTHPGAPSFSLLCSLTLRYLLVPR